MESPGGKCRKSGYVFIDTQLDVMSGKQDPVHMALHEKEKKFIYFNNFKEKERTQ